MGDEIAAGNQGRDMNFNKIEFYNASGNKLAARLDFPEDSKPPDVYAIFAHCFTCSKNLKAVVNINRALTRNGFGVLRFDFTGLGESEGEFSDTNFSTNISDIVSAADFLSTEYKAPQLLIGHSLGGAAMIHAASRIESAKALVTIGSPYDPSHLKTHLTGVLDKIEQNGQVEVILEGRPFKIKQQLLKDLEQSQMKAAITDLKTALLILHSPVDATVGIENAGKIFQTARHPKSFVSLDKADHLLANPEDSQYAGSIIAAWAQRYIRKSR